MNEYIFQISFYIRSKFIILLANTQFVRKSTLIKKKKNYTFKALLNFLLPSNECPGMKFWYSHSRPKLQEWFLVLPVPIPNNGNGFLYFPFPFPSRTLGKLFWFSRSRPKMQRVIPAHACVLIILESPS